MRAGHGDDLGFLDAQVSRSIEAGTKKLECPEFVKLCEDVLKY